MGYIETTNGKTSARYSYAYDDAGNRTGMVYYDASNTKYWTDYVYNENDELVAETYNYNKNKNKVISTKTTYTYDVDGNLVTKNTDGSDTWQYLWTAESRLEAVVAGGILLMAATYDGDNNRIFQISDASSSSKVHQESSLKSAWKKENGNSYPWEDGNGNGGNGTGHSNTGNGGSVNGGGHNHSGNNSDGLKHANCKQCVDTQEAFVQSMADDAVSIDGTDYLPVGKPNSYKDYELIYYINDVTIENEEVLVEYGAAGTATGTYEYGLQRLSVEYVNEAKEYYLYNGTGNVTQTTAENGSAFLRYTYDPFGNVTSIRAPMTVDIDDLNRYTYNGEDYDYNIGLQYLRARYYSTSTGSFISQDTYLGQTISPLSQNRYTYANNNPVMYDDPSGHSAETLKTIWELYQTYNAGAVIYRTVKNIVQAEKDYQYNKDTLVQAMAALAEDAKVLDLCEYAVAVATNGNVVYDYYSDQYLSFGSIEAARQYTQLMSVLFELKYNRGSAYTHMALDAFGMIPGIGAGFDAINGVIYFVEGDLSNAALSAGAIFVDALSATRAAKSLYNKISDFVSKTFKKAGEFFDGLLEGILRNGDEVVEDVATSGDELIEGIVENADGYGDGGNSVGINTNDVLGGEIKLPDGDSQLKHIFRDADGHLPDTLESRQRILDTANNPDNYLGQDERGNDWYAHIEDDGTQTWVRVRNGVVDNAGVNNVPRSWDPETGLYNNINKK